MDLEKLGILVGKKKGKIIHYFPAKDLTQHIKNLAENSA